MIVIRFVTSKNIIIIGTSPRKGLSPQIASSLCGPVYISWAKWSPMLAGCKTDYTVRSTQPGRLGLPVVNF